MPAKSKDPFLSRVFILSGVFVVWCCLLLLRLVNLQVFQYEELTARAKRQQSRSFEVSPQRGTIFDRHGRELAISVAVESIYAVPAEISNPKSASDLLGQALNLRPSDVALKLKGSRGFCWLKRKVDYSESAKVKALNLAGVYFEKESKRFYPKRELAAHVLGYVGMDNEGLSGLEFWYQREIGGSPGRIVLMTDARQRSYSSVERAPNPGKNLVLTIDQTIQYLTEQELVDQIQKSNALSGTAIVMNPATGEILAMASYPSFNPNHYSKYSPENWKNRAILTVYEPGSTFKTFTAATALEEHLTRPDEPIDCMHGAIVVGKHRIRDHKPYGMLPVRDVVAYSSNVGAVQLGFRIGKERFERYIRMFGFGAVTEIDLPGESRGLLRPSSQWPMATLANISMGQGIGVTPIQLITAVSSVANGGYRVRPHLLLQKGSGDTQRVSYQAERQSIRVLSDKTSSEVTEMLTGVILKGTAKNSQLEGFSAAGKTGTAQKVDPNGRYSHSRYIASFVGFAPTERPAIAIVVTVDEPHGKYYGAEVAAPVFRNIAEKTLRYLSVSPDQELTQKQLSMRRVLGKQTHNLATDEFEPVETNWQGELLEAKATTAELNASNQTVEPMNDLVTRIESAAAIEVPDLLGKSLRSALVETGKLGLQLGAYGSGLVVEQSPAAASKVEPGSRIVLKLSRRL